MHRDLKTDNFVVGIGSVKHKVFLLDMGLCKPYIDPTSGKHIPCISGNSLVGTAKFASTNAQLGIEQSRRDDLESLGYIMIYLYKGDLPWHGIQEKSQKERYRLIMETKIALPLEELCSDMPPCFEKYLSYVKKLYFEQIPNYKMLKSLFKKSFSSELEVKTELDWCIRRVEVEAETPLNTNIIKFIKNIQAQVVANKNGDPQYTKASSGLKSNINKPIRHLLRKNLTISQENANGDQISVGQSYVEEENILLEESPIPDEKDKGKTITLPKTLVKKESNKWGNIPQDIPLLIAKPKKYLLTYNT